MLALAAAVPPVEDAERAFAAAAQTKGQWTAFRDYAAPDAKMMIDGPQPAAPFLNGRPDPAVSVMWWPAHTVTSCDGTLAFSTGPWIRKGGKSSGRYFTIWQHDASGWRWVYDGGSGTALPTPAADRVDAVKAACGPGVPPTVPGPGIVASGISRDSTLRWMVIDKGGGQYELDVMYRVGNQDWKIERAIVG